MTRVSLCRDRRFYVETGFSKGGVATWCFYVAAHRADLHARQGVEHAHNRPGREHERVHQLRCCAHATMSTMCAQQRAQRSRKACDCANASHDRHPVVTRTSLSRHTCLVTNSALCCALFEHGHH